MLWLVLIFGVILGMLLEFAIGAYLNPNVAKMKDLWRIPIFLLIVTLLLCWLSYLIA